MAQDPITGFVTDTVEEELAYAMEQLAVPAAVMRTRVEETLDLLGIADLRGRPLRDLSGGQQQRVAIGSVLTAGPRILVLDEPTSALDPAAAEEVLAAMLRLVHDLGLTVVLAEHRLERALQYADRVVRLAPDGTAVSGAPTSVMADAPIAPPIVDLGRLAGWDPLPLSIRDARQRASELLTRLVRPGPRSPVPAGPVVLAATGISVRYGATIAVRDVDLELRGGQVAVLMGRNGSGKSSLLWALHGADHRTAGHVNGDGTPSALVPQTPGDLVFLDTVAAECAAADADAGRPSGTTAELLERLQPGIDPAAHPRDLSEGQRLALVLAIQLAAGPRVILLDEPTRGLDYPTKRRFASVLARLASAGAAVLVATHDVELAAIVADRVLVLAEGDLVADGAPAGDPVRLHGARTAGLEDPRPRLADRRPGPRRTRRGAGRERCVVTAQVRARALPIPLRSVAVLAAGSIAAALAFCWPLIIGEVGADAARIDSPLLFVAVLPILVLVMLTEVAAGRLDARALAMLGVLSALGAAVRPLGAGTAGRRDGLRAGRPGRTGVRGRLRVRAWLDDAPRIGAADRRRRSVAAVPDAGGLLDRAWAPGCCRPCAVASNS